MAGWVTQIVPSVRQFEGCCLCQPALTATASQSTKYRIFLSNYNYLQIEAIFDLGDVDGDGTIDMDEFVGKNLSPESNN